MKQYIIIALVIIALFTSCAPYISISFNNRTDEDIILYVNQQSEDRFFSRVDTLKVKTSRGVILGRDPNENTRKQFSRIYNDILVVNLKNDTILYLPNNENVKKYFKHKGKVSPYNKLNIPITKSEKKISKR